jgi:hypothetical protein
VRLSSVRLDFPVERGYAGAGKRGDDGTAEQFGEERVVRRDPRWGRGKREGDVMTMHGPYGDDYVRDETSDLVRSLALSSAKLWEELFERLGRLERAQSELRELVAKIEVALPASLDGISLERGDRDARGALPAVGSSSFGDILSSAGTEAEGTSDAAAEGESDLPRWSPGDVPTAGWAPSPSGSASRLDSEHDGTGDLPRSFLQASEESLPAGDRERLDELALAIEWHAPEPVSAEAAAMVQPWAPPGGEDEQADVPSTASAAASNDEFGFFGVVGSAHAESLPPPPFGFQSDAPPPPPPPGFSVDAPVQPPPPPFGFQFDAPPPPPPPGFSVDAPGPSPSGFSADAPPPPPPGFVPVGPPETAVAPPLQAPAFESSEPAAPPPPFGFHVEVPPATPPFVPGAPVTAETPALETSPSVGSTGWLFQRLGHGRNAAPPPPPDGFAIVRPAEPRVPEVPVEPDPTPVAEEPKTPMITPDFFARAGRRRN